MLFVFPSYLSAQELVVGGGLAVGVGWEIERLPINAPTTENRGIAGDNGFELYGFVGYRIDRFTVGVRPSLLTQETTVFRLMGDDGIMSFQDKVYPLALILPLRMEITFGDQRLQPVLGLGGGFLLDLADDEHDLAPQPESILPFLEVTVGMNIHVRKWRLRPELTVRNGTAELFNPNRNSLNQAFGGQRWGYASIGIIVSN